MGLCRVWYVAMRVLGVLVTGWAGLTVMGLAWRHRFRWHRPHASSPPLVYPLVPRHLRRRLESVDDLLEDIERRGS